MSHIAATGVARLRAAAASRTETGALAGVARWEVVVLALTLLLALGLRLQGLAREALWVDEAATLGIAGLSLPDFRDTVLWIEANPPGYYALMALWRAVAPGDEAWLRLPSVLAGTATLLPVWLFCRRGVGPVAAAIAVLLLATSVPHVRFSQEARTYALLVLCFAGALVAAQVLVGRLALPLRGRVAAAAALGGLMAAMMYLHATGVVASAAVGAYALGVLAARGVLNPARLAPLVGAALGAALLALPWVIVAVGLATRADSVMSWQPPLTAAHAWETVRSMLLAPLLQRLVLPATALQLVLVGIAVAAWRRQPEVLGSLAALLAGLGLMVAISLAEPILFERTLLFAVLPWIVLLAAGLATLRRPVLIALALAPLLALQARGLQNLQSLALHEEPWDRLAAHVASHGGPADAVVAVGVFEAVAADHYLRAVGSARPLAVVPLHYEGPFVPMARAMLHPRVVSRDPAPGEVCAALAGGAAWLLARDAPGLWEAEGPRLGAILAAAGARLEGEQRFGKLALQRWTGGCGAGS